MSDAEQGFLADIIANPDNDDLRLIYADWLQENAGKIDCEFCVGVGVKGWMSGVVDCPECGGAGRIYDDRAKRAEFIRVQIELAQWHDWARTQTFLGFFKGPEWGKQERLKIQESSLMHVMHSEMSKYKVAGGHPNNDCIIRRGFFEYFKLSAEDWVKHADEITSINPIKTVDLLTMPDCRSAWGRKHSRDRKHRIVGMPWVRLDCMNDPPNYKRIQLLLKHYWPKITFTLA